MLKIEALASQIKEVITSNNISLISTSTGSGKTMYVPTLAYKISNNTVYVLMPRVIMAQQAARGVVALGLLQPHEVGIMTSKIKNYNSASKVVFCTEGSFLNSGVINKMKNGDYICVDEIHEAGSLTTAILHMAKDWVKNFGVNVILLSATVDVEKYKNYYRGFSFGSVNEPESPRPYPVTSIVVDDPIKACYEAYYEGGRVLIGTAGKPDIEQYINGFKAIDKNVKVFPVHGELEIEQVNEAMGHEGPAIFVATNILQSGITINQLTHLYVDGYGNRIENRNGISSLVRYELSQAEMKQWAGRIGRTCSGTQFITADEQNKVRQVCPDAEILRSPLMETYASMLQWGIQMENVELIDQPNQDNIISAKNALEKLKITKEGSITSFGQSVLSHGVGVRAGVIIQIGQILQIQNIALKINAIERIGHPFRNYNKKSQKDKIYYSDFVYWIDEIENIIRQLGYHVNQMDHTAFDQYCTKNGIFRRNLTKLMHEFEKIDNMYSDNSGQDKKIKALLYIANLDRIVSDNVVDNIYVGKSNKSKVVTEKYMFGNIISIGRNTFIEGVTTINEEEKNLFDQLL